MKRVNGIDHKVQGSKTPSDTLVLIHGLGASSNQFADLLDFGDRGIRLLLVDLPGHARNICREPERAAGFNTFSELIIDLCDRLDLRRSVFCGISMGSALSLKIAAKRPDLVRHVVAVRPAWMTSQKPVHLKLIGLIGELFENHDAEDVLARLEAVPSYRELAADVSGSAASVRGVVTRDNAREHAPVLTAIYGDRPFARLADMRAVECPVDVLGTNADALHPIALAHQTANALPNARFGILPPRYLEPAAHAAALKETLWKVMRQPHGDHRDYQKG
ncbi:alpha/beta fold hydrolase [Roseibium sp. SCP14]|uniref:alpha/beta fold hydrolase n=1 Tax=Roseibium sp. SCP14 TaxID=3141375 RepID=UPI00333A2D95